MSDFISPALPFLFAAWILLGTPSPAWSAHPSSRFESACKDAFIARAGADGQAAAAELCRCAAKEGQKARVKGEVFDREAAAIAKDPAYQIQDQKLMDALRVCAIDQMEAAAHQLEERKR